MNLFRKIVMVAGIVGAILAPVAVQAQEKLGEGLTIYIQHGGLPGAPENVSRVRGATDAAALLGVNLISQHAGWDNQIMVSQAKVALAARPDAMIINGGPGYDAYANIIKEAKAEGIVVVISGDPMDGSGLSYFGGFNYGTGKVLGERIIKDGKLKAGDHAVVYAEFALPSQIDIARGATDALDEAGIVYDKLQWTQQAVLDPGLAVPVLVGYLEANPNTKAIVVPGHGGITAVLAKVMKDAGKKPGSIVLGGYDISPAALQGLREGYLTVVVDQQFYESAFMAVTQAVLEKRFKLKNVVANTATGVVTQSNVEDIAALVEAGVR
jgi:simple sugar transport system substrate-binding protein